jgi:Zn finger protein HypA/HybF involved in hydrogenase expression
MKNETKIWLKERDIECPRCPRSPEKAFESHKLNACKCPVCGYEFKVEIKDGVFKEIKQEVSV